MRSNSLLRSTIVRCSACAFAIAATVLFGCESSSTRSAPSRQAAGAGFDPGASEWARRGPRRETLPEPQPYEEPTVASQASPEQVEARPIVVALAEESVVETDSATESDAGWIGGDLLAGESEVVAVEEPAAAPTAADDGWIGDDLLAGEAPVAIQDEPSLASIREEAVPPPPPVREPVVEQPARPTPPSTPHAAVATGTVVAGRSQGEPTPTPVPVSVEERAMAILRQAARSPDASIRANAIESLLASPATLEEVVTAGLVDSNRGVRFVAAMCIGRARISNLSHLVEPLVRDSSPSVRAAAIYALRRCGRPADPTLIAGMLRSDDPEIRSNAFAVLGELGDRSAAPMVRESLGKGMRRVNPIRVRIVELQGAETLVRLGSEEDIEAIRAALFAPVEQGELSILACQILARVGDQSAVPMLERLIMASGTSARPPEIRLAAAQAIAELGARTQIDLLALASNAARAPDPLVRMQATAVLGWLGGSAAESVLASMLSDPVESVRVTAAGNLLRLAAESANPSAARPMR